MTPIRPPDRPTESRPADAETSPAPAPYAPVEPTVSDTHLTPTDFDRLLDGEIGPDDAPLWAHLEACPSCAAELDLAREVVFSLETLPDFAPAPGFADRVMQEVDVFEPWHVAASETVLRLLPASRPARMWATLGAAAGLAMTTVIGRWLLAQADIPLLMAAFGLEQVRGQAAAAGREVTLAALGQPGLSAVQTASAGSLVLMAGGFVLIVGLGLVGLRTLAVDPSGSE